VNLLRVQPSPHGSYLQMVCVESGNIAENAITLSPGESSALIVEIDSVPPG
jgi:D-hexose-6-phosphate mutarotase